MKEISPLRQAGFFDSTSAPEYLGIKKERFRRLREYGVIPEPTREVNTLTLKYYNREDLDEIKAMINQWTAPPKKTTRPPTDPNLYNQVQAAKFLNMPKITLWLWIHEGKIDPPSHPNELRIKCYNTKELRAIEKKQRRYFERRQRSMKKAKEVS